MLQEFDWEVRDKKGSENLVADHLSRLDKDRLKKHDDGVPINETFHGEHLFNVTPKEVPWFADIANYLVSDVLPYGMDYRQKKKFLHDCRFYYWEEPLLYKRCADGLIRRCIPQDEIHDVLMHCHSLDVGGHFGASKTASKVLQSSFWWPTLFKDAREYVLTCDRCQRVGNISKKHEMPLMGILEVELFDVWGTDFMGPFPDRKSTRLNSSHSGESRMPSSA